MIRWTELTRITSQARLVKINWASSISHLTLYPMHIAIANLELRQIRLVQNCAAIHQRYSYDMLTREERQKPEEKTNGISGICGQYVQQKIQDERDEKRWDRQR